VGVAVADIVFLIDNSASIGYIDRSGVTNWQRILDFIKGITGAFVIGRHATRVAVISFG